MTEQIDHHRRMIEQALQWQAQQDANFVYGCSNSTTGEVSQYLSTLSKLMGSQDARLWPHQAAEFIKHYGENI